VKNVIEGNGVSSEWSLLESDERAVEASDHGVHHAFLPDEILSYQRFSFTSKVTTSEKRTYKGKCIHFISIGIPHSPIITGISPRDL
jgi:hypothetical protein